MPLRCAPLLALVLVAACSSGPTAVWQAPFNREHPLAGRIYRVPRAATSATPATDGAFTSKDFLTARQLVAQLAETDYVLLGEQHDNPDHHRLQAWILRELIRSGRKPALIMEMLDADQQPLVESYRRRRHATAAGFGAAVDWQARGWPDYRMYAPLISLALGNGLPVRAANLRRDVVQTLLSHDNRAASRSVLAKLELAEPLSHKAHAAMTREVIRAHCGYADKEFAETMVVIQHARDIRMARALGRYGSAVLIAGAGHIRKDRGIEALLRRSRPRRTVAGVAFIEVSEDIGRPRDYAEGFSASRLPFDYVWFTPRQSDQDPCERFRKQLEEKLGPRATLAPDRHEHLRQPVTVHTPKAPVGSQ